MSADYDMVLLSRGEDVSTADGIEKLSADIEGALEKFSAVVEKSVGKGSKSALGEKKKLPHQLTAEEHEKRRQSETSLQAALDEALKEEKALFSRGRPSKNTAAGNTAARIREIAASHGVTNRSLLRAYRRKVITAESPKSVKKGRKRILADDIEAKLASFVRFLNLINISVSTLQLRQIGSRITAVCGKKALNASNHWASDFKNRYDLKGCGSVSSSKPSIPTAVKGAAAAAAAGSNVELDTDATSFLQTKKSYTDEQLTEIVAVITGIRPAADSSEGGGGGSAGVAAGEVISSFSSEFHFLIDAIGSTGVAAEVSRSVPISTPIPTYSSSSVPISIPICIPTFSSSSGGGYQHYLDNDHAQQIDDDEDDDDCLQDRHDGHDYNNHIAINSNFSPKRQRIVDSGSE